MENHILIQRSSGTSLRAIICSFMFFFPHLISFAQNAQIEYKIRDLDEKQSAWMLKEDTNDLKKIYDTDLIVNAPFNAVTSGSSVVFNLVRSGFIKLSAFDIEIEKVLIKDDVAISMGSETITFDKNSTNPQAGQTIKRRYTHVYINEKGSWKLIARHANEVCK